MTRYFCQLLLNRFGSGRKGENLKFAVNHLSLLAGSIAPILAQEIISSGFVYRPPPCRLLPGQPLVDLPLCLNCPKRFDVRRGWSKGFAVLGGSSPVAVSDGGLEPA